MATKKEVHTVPSNVSRAVSFPVRREHHGIGVRVTHALHVHDHQVPTGDTVREMAERLGRTPADTGDPAIGTVVFLVCARKITFTHHDLRGGPFDAEHEICTLTASRQHPEWTET